MDARKYGIDRLADHSREVLVDDRFVSSYPVGDALYDKTDLMVIYKAGRLKELGVVSEEEYYELVELYNDYQELLSRAAHIFYLKSQGMLDEYTFDGEKIDTDELENKLLEMNAKLEEYQLLPDYVTLNYLIDLSINDNEMKKRLK